MHRKWMNTIKIKITDHHKSSTILKSDMVMKTKKLMVKVINNWLLSNRTLAQISIRSNSICSIELVLRRTRHQAKPNFYNNKIQMIYILRWIKKKIRSLLLVLNIKMLMDHLTFRSVQMTWTKEALKLLLFKHRIVSRILHHNLLNRRKGSNSQHIKWKP